MTEKPIIFSGPMVRAILDGRKTMTRRIVHRLRRFGVVTEFGTSDTKGYDWHFRDKRMHWNDLRHEELLTYLPYAPGDVLWVREGLKFNESDFVCYAADMSPVTALVPTGYTFTRNSMPSIFMPRWASRITLKVTAVKVHRLQEITEEDAKAEGVERLKSGRGYYSAKHGRAAVHFGVYHDYAAEAFADLWDSIHGPGAWDANPWCAAYSFERIAT
jgi:hypothetical protein